MCLVVAFLSHAILVCKLLVFETIFVMPNSEDHNVLSEHVATSTLKTLQIFKQP